MDNTWGEIGMRLKILPSSLRKRKRYVAFKVISEEPIIYSDLEAAILNSFLTLYGEAGVSKIEPKIIKDLWDKKQQITVIRCNHKEVPKTITALGAISRLGDSRATIKILKVSGTIKKIKASIANKYKE